MEKKEIFNKTILIVIAIGIWMLVLQNINVFDSRKDVYVRGGYISSDVSGSVRINNEVDVNISSVNGYRTKSYNNGHLGVSAR